MTVDKSQAQPHMQIANIHWQTWQAEIICTLMFIVKDNQVLLIRKKRGLGAGKINGPGGKLDPGETPLACAIRETEEELLVTPEQIDLVAELFFHAEDMPRIHAYAYIAQEYSGTPTETEEASPIWFDIEEIPFNEMWQDDQYWLGAALGGSNVRGWFSFEEETLLDYKVELTPRSS